ncbi:hypothetical protein B0H12DRAFT_210065 [Mycena haematopus]|nr:hypothetical protein B0H12DRAFT_210065 [Mycena haematopus]
MSGLQNSARTKRAWRIRVGPVLLRRCKDRCGRWSGAVGNRRRARRRRPQPQASHLGAILGAGVGAEQDRNPGEVRRIGAGVEADDGPDGGYYGICRSILEYIWTDDRDDTPKPDSTFSLSLSCRPRYWASIIALVLRHPYE